MKTFSENVYTKEQLKTLTFTFSEAAAVMKALTFNENVYKFLYKMKIFMKTFTFSNVSRPESVFINFCRGSSRKAFSLIFS